MFFQPSLALAALPELGPRTRDALLALLPGAVTLVLPNPSGRFPLACGEDRTTLGLRVPALPPALAALEQVTWPVWQSSANLAGGRPARRLEEVPRELRLAADMVLDGGPLPGTASTVVDLRHYEDDGTWTVQRAGAVSEDDLAARLG
jgi:L-threonylcarbamoyladenylate synthase